MNLLFDHVVVVVPDLDEAVRDFGEAGFVVVPGGRHDAIPTANALVAFEDGGYLELLAVRDSAAFASLARMFERGDVSSLSPVARRFLPNLLESPGVADYVLHGADIACAAIALRRGGIPHEGPMEMTRERPDGTRLAWEMVFPTTAALPFLIEDRTPRELRVPSDPTSCAHPNGAKGVREIEVHALDVAMALREYSVAFAVSPTSLAGGRWGLSFGDLRVILAPGELDGARALALRGCRTLPPSMTRLGVHVDGDSRSIDIGEAS